jgi:hypothetical protein
MHYFSTGCFHYKEFAVSSQKTERTLIQPEERTSTESTEQLLGLTPHRSTAWGYRYFFKKRDLSGIQLSVARKINKFRYQKLS